MQQKNEPKSRVITLTGRAPVRIVEDDWPLVASATDDSYTGPDYGRYQQALGRGEVDLYHLYVRRHADGRAIVYAVFIGATAWTGHGSSRGGDLLAGGDDVAAAVRRIGEECGIPDHVIRACTADLPAEDLA